MPALASLPRKTNRQRNSPDAQGDTGRRIDESYSRAIRKLIDAALPAREVLNVAPLFSEIEDLMNEPPEDAYGPLRPSQFAESTAKAMLHGMLELAAQKQFIFPDGGVTADSEGGIRIEWSAPGKAVYFVARRDSAKGTYVYRETAGKCTVDHNITPSFLLRLLEEFVGI